MIVAGLVFLASAAFRGVVIAAIVAVGLFALRVARTDARLLAWQMVLYAAIALPMLMLVLPSRDWSPPSLPATVVQAWAPALATEPAASATPSAAVRVVAPHALVPSSARAAEARVTTSWPHAFALMWPRIIAPAYLGGVLLLLIRGAVGWWITRRLESAAVDIREAGICERLQGSAERCGLRRPPRLAESTALIVPVTTSVLKPAILLPRGWAEWPPATADAVLAHELAHIERGDLLTQRLALVYRAVFWFSPLAWWLHRELVRLAEDASDEAALAAGARPSAYAEVLLAFFASIRSTSQRARWSAVAMARGRDAERRIERVLAWRRASRALSRPVLFCLALAASQIATLAASAHLRVPDITLPTLASIPKLPATRDWLAPTAISLVPLIASVQSPVAQGRSPAAGSPAGAPQGGSCDLCKAIDDPRLAWLQGYVGRSTFDAVQDAHFRDLIGMVVPNATFHFRMDMPLSEAWTTILRGAGQPVEGRNSRYIWLSACVTPTCQSPRGLAFLWVDALNGIAIGAIYFAPSNGEPTPTLTIFSKQQGPALTSASQLPDAFLHDLASWSAKSRVKEVSARYFISGNGEKSVVPHDERACGGGAPGGAAVPPCGSMDLRLAEKDLDAAVYLADSHNATGSPAQLALRLSQNLWAQSRAKACGATQSPADIACHVQFVRDRVHVLQSGGTR